MITYVRTKPFPRCRYCNIRMDYYMPFVADEKHAHPECEGKHLAEKSINKIKSAIGENE